MTDTANLDLVLARLALGVATPEDSDRVAELLDADDPSAIVDRMPAPERAAWTLLEVHIGAIAHGKLPPEQGLTLVIEVFRSPELVPSARRAMGASHDADRLVALQDAYDDAHRRERQTGSTVVQTPQIDAQVVLAAREWMARNATGRA
ncbi:MAG TPA: hypothetical protein VFG89_02295 [Coriobacteriia bacterium]|nr:hypothetical protein [Coriobacteriia bacterium]